MKHVLVRFGGVDFERGALVSTDTVCDFSYLIHHWKTKKKERITKSERSLTLEVEVNYQCTMGERLRTRENSN